MDNNSNGHGKISFSLLQHVRKMDELIIQLAAERFIIDKIAHGEEVFIHSHRTITVQKGPVGSAIKVPALTVKDLKKGQWIRLVDPEEIQGVGLCLIVGIWRDDLQGYVRTEGYNEKGARAEEWDVELSDEGLRYLKAQKIVSPLAEVVPPKPPRKIRQVREVSKGRRMGLKEIS